MTDHSRQGPHVSRGLSRIAMGGAVSMLLCLAASAHAQTAEVEGSSDTPEAIARADELYKQGNALIQAGQHEASEAAYRAAWEAHRTPRTAANLGMLERSRGKPRDAAEHLQYAIDAYPAGAKPAGLVLLRDELAEAKRAIGTLIVRATSPARVLVQGTPRGSTGDGPIYVDPGAVVVQVERDGYVPYTETVQIAAGEERTIEVTLGFRVPAALRRPLPPGDLYRSEPPAPTPTWDDGSSTLITAIWVGAAGTVLAGGVSAGALAANEQDAALGSAIAGAPFLSLAIGSAVALLVLPADEGASAASVRPASAPAGSWGAGVNVTF